MCVERKRLTDTMQKLFSFFLACMMAITFISCERSAGGGEDPTPTEDTTPTVQPSPIKGVWECQLNGVHMSLTFGDSNVEYEYCIEAMEATALYKGTYTIKDSDITIIFTSLTTKNSSKITYTNPADMAKEATLVDASTIVYLDYTFTRK